jgi:hypothetical protein
MMMEEVAGWLLWKKGENGRLKRGTTIRMCEWMNEWIIMLLSQKEPANAGATTVRTLLLFCWATRRSSEIPLLSSIAFTATIHRHILHPPSPPSGRIIRGFS